jgi:catechol 2,3-dioxygenase-like lactoylglutathione lyase family enzyme
VLETSPLVAFAPATDLDRAQAFYAGVLGLPLVERSPYACVFAAAGTTLRVTLVGATAGAPYTILGWEVPDIAVTVGALALAGVIFLRYDGMAQDDQGVWTTPDGARVAWFPDPDGNVLSLTQR